MIIVKYLVKEVFKSQIAILFILLLIFFCQKLVRILSAAVEGDVPTSLVFSLLGLGIPDMAQLILPLSLFLGILMTYTKLYSESEITAMFACGIGKKALIQAAMILSLFTGALALANVVWFGPWSQVYQSKVLAEAKANPGVSALVEGQFQKSSDGNIALFVADVSGNRFKHIFMAQVNPTENQRPSVVVANSGFIEQTKTGEQIIHLDNGTRYEGNAIFRDFKITDFKNYQAIIGYKPPKEAEDDEEQASLQQLLEAKTSKSIAEFNWRLTLILCVPLMAFMVVPLTAVNPRQGRVLSMLPAMLLYLVYFLLQSSLKSNAGKEKIDPITWVWLVNLVYFLIAVIVNSWDSIPVRRIRARLRGRI